MARRFRAQDAEADHLAVAQPRVANDDAPTALATSGRTKLTATGYRNRRIRFWI
jgi:hypothetical protein